VYGGSGAAEDRREHAIMAAARDWSWHFGATARTTGRGQRGRRSVEGIKSYAHERNRSQHGSPFGRSVSKMFGTDRACGGRSMVLDAGAHEHVAGISGEALQETKVATKATRTRI
jgi:hypothetical protein